VGFELRVELDELEDRARRLRNAATDMERLVEAAYQIADPTGWLTGASSTALVESLTRFRRAGLDAAESLAAIGHAMSEMSDAFQQLNSNVAFELLEGTES
jgi:hypothetical protein